MLFIEAEGEEAVLHEATRQLLAHGYLLTDKPAGSVILMEFLLRDAPGSVLPVLRLIHQFSFNISYIRYQAEKGGPQRFRMGLLVENSQAISAFIRQASDLCEISILQYDETEKNLDNTVFYISFANRIAERVGLSKRDKACLLYTSGLLSPAGFCLCRRQFFRSPNKKEGKKYFGCLAVFPLAKTSAPFSVLPKSFCPLF